MNDLELAQKYVATAESAKSRNIEFTLSLTSYRNLMRSKKCFYTQVPFKNKGIYKRTIDRIDNKKGYIHGNVVACTQRINSMKNSWESQNLSLIDVEKVINIVKKQTDF